MAGPGKADRGDSERERESRRILKDIASETEVSGNSFVNRMAKRTHDHMTAADADTSDRMDYLGTRIGRILGPVLAIGLVIWFVLFIVQGG
ncbi:hypothetical protein ASD64_00045 [Mesorhizobium sp. Root157]|uniref:hypothetical protein n=1 Tax=Mesorhizobium sp. Root157 TaxID=1736477 RepID=UPI0006F5434A|nr:hypothetical protein [Mesorhizobium sp. Root157]KRA00021.1 hypothetical protein ASD64_00045 [Mesorhizobium sp. Root157]